MSKFAMTLAYNGRNYAGWQIQDNAETVQGILENALSVLLRMPISIMGCGRTDSGVHASAYLAHFDYAHELPSNFLYRINAFLPSDIVVYEFLKVNEDFHARFSAKWRTYKYLLDFAPSIYSLGSYYYCPFGKGIHLEKMTEAASILTEYEDFYPFCKSRVQIDHFKCQLIESRWEQVSETRWIYTVKANRFLRGMVRLMVGMCINVGRERMKLSEVRDSLQSQNRLPDPWSVPAEGLYLYEIDYGSLLSTKVSSNPLFFPI